MKKYLTIKAAIEIDDKENTINTFDDCLNDYDNIGRPIDRLEDVGWNVDFVSLDENPTNRSVTSDNLSDSTNNENVKKIYVLEGKENNKWSIINVDPEDYYFDKGKTKEQVEKAFKEQNAKNDDKYRWHSFECEESIYKIIQHLVNKINNSHSQEIHNIVNDIKNCLDRIDNNCDYLKNNY